MYGKSVNQLKIHQKFILSSIYGYFWKDLKKKKLKFYKKSKNLQKSLIFFFILPVIMFQVIEQWSLIDSIYFCIVTLTTVGFGDLSPSPLQVFTVKEYILKNVIRTVKISMEVTLLCSIAGSAACGKWWDLLLSRFCSTFIRLKKLHF